MRKRSSSNLYTEGLAKCTVEYPLHLLNAELNRLFINAAGEFVSPHVREKGRTSDGDTDFEIYVDKAMVAPALKDFCTRHDFMVSKKLVDVKRLDLPDPLLHDAEGGDAEVNPVTVDSLSRRLLERGTKRQPSIRSPPRA